MGNRILGSYKITQQQPVMSAGIYHNPTEGLISLSSDGQNWITISDKNLGATQVYNLGDTYTEDNSGKLYQRGNNYGFDYGQNATSSQDKVDTTGYGPGNYYSRNIFVAGAGSDNWSDPANADLRGNVTDTLEARQGPCDNGFHIMSELEWNNFVNLINNLGLDGMKIQTYEYYLFFPVCGGLRNAGGFGMKNEYAFYYTTSTLGNIIFAKINDVDWAFWNKNNGGSIRPFKNIPVTPDSTRTILYQPN